MVAVIVSPMARAGGSVYAWSAPRRMRIFRKYGAGITPDCGIAGVERGEARIGDIEDGDPVPLESAFTKCDGCAHFPRPPAGPRADADCTNGIDTRQGAASENPRLTLRNGDVLHWIKHTPSGGHIHTQYGVKHGRLGSLRCIRRLRYRTRCVRMLLWLGIATGYQGDEGKTHDDRPAARYRTPERFANNHA